MYLVHCYNGMCLGSDGTVRTDTGCELVSKTSARCRGHHGVLSRSSVSKEFLVSCETSCISGHCSWLVNRYEQLASLRYMETKEKRYV